MNRPMDRRFMTPGQPKYRVDPRNSPEILSRAMPGFGGGPLAQIGMRTGRVAGGPNEAVRLDAMRGIATSLAAAVAGVPVGQNSACQEVQNTPELFKYAMVVAEGIKTAMGGASLKHWSAWDPSGFFPPVMATPFDLRGAGVIQVPAAAPTAEQTTSFQEAIRANGGGTGINKLSIQQTIANSLAANSKDARQTLQSVVGVGPFATLYVDAGEIVVCHSFGVSTWNLLAEQELAWQILGEAAGTPANSATTVGLAPSSSSMILPPIIGWPYGDTTNPALLTGFRVFPRDNVVSSQTRVSVVVQHLGVQTTTEQSTCHYAECVLRGWKVKVGADGCISPKTIAGAPCASGVCK